MWTPIIKGTHTLIP